MKNGKQQRKKNESSTIFVVMRYRGTEGQTKKKEHLMFIVHIPYTIVERHNYIRVSDYQIYNFVINIVNDIGLLD